MDWSFIWLMLVLKLPLVLLLWLVWWAIHQAPEEGPSSGGEGGTKVHPRHPRPHQPRRRGPHGDPPLPSPVRVRTTVARARTRVG